MADWSLIESTLETWTNNLTSLPTYWVGRPRSPSFNNAGYCLLSISAIRTLGIDQIYGVFDETRPQGTEYQFFQRGHRVFTFGIQVRTQRQSVDNDAKNYTSIINDSLRLPIKTVDVLRAADISIAKALSETNIDTTLDGRDLSISQLDLRMNARTLVEDTPVGYIDTLSEVEIQDTDGNVLWTGDIAVG